MTHGPNNDELDRIAALEDEVRKLKLRTFGEAGGGGADDDIVWTTISSSDFAGGVAAPNGTDLPMLGYDDDFLHLRGFVIVSALGDGGDPATSTIFSGLAPPAGRSLGGPQAAPVLAQVAAYGPPLQDHLPDPCGFIIAQTALDGMLSFQLNRDSGFGYYADGGTYGPFQASVNLNPCRFTWAI